MVICKHGTETVNGFPLPPSEVRDAIINVVKILLILTFLPIGTTDQLDYAAAEVKSATNERTAALRTTQSISVLGGIAMLLCNTTAPSPKNPPILVIWYKNGGGDPVYSYDLRGSGPEATRHWTDSHVLGRRASFQMSGKYLRSRGPGSNTMLSTIKRRRRRSALKIRDVAISDRGIYKCRVDFQGAPTRNSRANLTVIVPPKTPVIVDESGIEASATIGPYAEGSTVEVSCEVSGGRPKPRVRWLQSGIPLGTSSEVSSGSTVTSSAILESLDRSDNGLLLTCEASNNNISKPVRHSVSLLMNLAPTALWVSKKEQHLLAGTKVTYPCFSVGAYPQNRFIWLLDDTKIHEKPSDGNKNKVVTNSSHLIYTPQVGDNGKELICESDNPDLPGSALRDSLVLNIHYIPMVQLEFGKNLETENIKEGDDAYFECHVEARPEITKIQWMHNGIILKHNVTLGTIISNQSLVLQTLERKDAGSYVCEATNAEGTSSSNELNLNIKYTPICASTQPSVLGVATNEHLEISCEVDANPTELKFHWAFNNNTRNVNYHDDIRFAGTMQKQNIYSGDEAGNGYLTSYISNGTRSILTYSPGEERQYGTILCFANNGIGRQKKACAFHLIPAGRPEPVHNCTQIERSHESIMLKCSPGFDGGLAQLFTLELRPWTRSINPLDNKGMMMRSNSVAANVGVNSDSDPNVMIRNVTSNKPVFYVKNLKPGTRFEARVYTSNQKGRSSEVFVLRASTLKRASDKRPVTSLASGAATDDNPLIGSGGELITSSVSHRDSSVVLKNGKSEGASLSSSSDGSTSSINLSGLIGNFPARTILMIVGSFTVVLIVVAVSIGVICRIQFRSVPSSSSPPCIIQRINNGSRSSGHSRRGSCDGDSGRDKRIVLLSINGGGTHRRCGSSQESLTGDNIDNDRHSLSVASVATSDDRAMMQLQRVASTTTVMMAMTTASTPGDSESDNGLLGSATTFTSDVRRFSVPNHDINQMRNEHHQQLNNCGGSLEHSLQHPNSSLAIVRQQQQDSYHSELSQGKAMNSIMGHQAGVGQPGCIAVPVKSADGRKMPSQLQIDNMQLQHPYHHHIPQAGKPSTLTLDAGRLSEDPQKSGNEAESIQHFQRVQASLTLPLERYHHPGTTISSAALIHHNHAMPVNPHQYLESSASHPFQTITPTMDGAGGRIALSTFSPSNPTFSNPINLPPPALLDQSLPLPAPPEISLLTPTNSNGNPLVPIRQILSSSDVYSPPPPSLSSTSSSFSGPSVNGDAKNKGPGGINTFPRRITDPYNRSIHMSDHYLVSPNSSNHRAQNPSNIRDKETFNPQDHQSILTLPRDRNVFSGQTNNIPIQNIGSSFQREPFQLRFENGSSSNQSPAPVLQECFPVLVGNLKSSLESLASGDQQQRSCAHVPAPRKTVTFKGDIQTIQCSPEEQQERRCWRHQSPMDSSCDDYSDDEHSSHAFTENSVDAANNSESNGSGDSGDGEEKELVESRV